MIKRRILTPDQNEILVDGEPVSKSNPFHSQPTDHSGRVGLMSVFGEQIVGTRIAQVSGQFKYGLPSTGVKSNIVGSGTITVIDALLNIDTGTDSDGAASIANRRPIRYIPGYDTFCNWTAVFTGTHNSETGVTLGVADSYQRTGLFDDNDGFFIGFENEVFGFTRRRLGTDYFTPINLKLFKRNEGYALDLTKGNIFRLNYGYLGFATVIVDVLEPDGNWANLFKLKWPNSSTVTHITQTFLEPRMDVANEGNLTNINIKVGSFNAGIIDGGGQTPSTRTFANSGTFTGTGNQDLIAYRNKSQFNGFENKVPALATWLSLAVEGNKPFIAELIINPTVDTAGTWVDINTNDSIMEYSINTVWNPDGALRVPFSLAKIGELDKIIKDLNVEWLPEDILVIRLITAATGYDATVGFEWDEQF